MRIFQNSDTWTISFNCDFKTKKNLSSFSSRFRTRELGVSGSRHGGYATVTPMIFRFFFYILNVLFVHSSNKKLTLLRVRTLKLAVVVPRTIHYATGTSSNLGENFRYIKDDFVNRTWKRRLCLQRNSNPCHFQLVGKGTSSYATSTYCEGGQTFRYSIIL